MKFLGLATALMAGTAVAFPGIGRRDTTSTNSSLTTVSASFTRLDGDVRPWDSSTLAGLQQYFVIRDDSQKLANDLQSAVSTISGNSGTFGLFDSIQLYLQRTILEIPLAGYVLLMIASKPKFDSILGVLSVRKQILAFLTAQSSLTQQMDKAFAKILHPWIAPLMQFNEAAEQLLFTAAIAVYQQPAPAGHIEVPDGVDPSPSLIPSTVASAK